MAHGNVTEEGLAELIRRTVEAASALIGGDIRGYLTCIRHADDYTLMAPSGGEPRRGFDASDEALDAMALLPGRRPGRVMIAPRRGQTQKPADQRGPLSISSI